MVNVYYYINSEAAKHLYNLYYLHTQLNPRRTAKQHNEANAKLTNARAKRLYRFSIIHQRYLPSQSHTVRMKTGFARLPRPIVPGRLLGRAARSNFGVPFGP